MKQLLLGVVVAAVLVGFMSQSVSAMSLKVTPLEYRTSLKTGEKKKGVVDVSNPTLQTVRVKTSVEAFSQVDDKGTLKFYKQEQVAAGVALDLDEFDLGPRQAVRMYFQLDGAKLPSGDVFAAIFFTIQPEVPKVGVAQTIRLGTLLSIVNGTPGSREAEIKSLDVPFFNLGDSISGRYEIKNTAKVGTATGFYPKVTLLAQPFGESKTQVGKLIFAERTRENSFSLKTPPFGFYQIKVSYQGSERSSIVFVAHPIALAAFVFLLILAVTVLRYTHPQLRRFLTRRSSGK